MKKCELLDVGESQELGTYYSLIFRPNFFILVRLALKYVRNFIHSKQFLKPLKNLNTYPFLTNDLFSVLLNRDRPTLTEGPE